MDHDFLILIVRICLSAVFLYSGIDKLVCWDNGLRFCIRHRMPQPKVVLAATAVVHIAGALMVLLGVMARSGAVLLLLFTIIATWWVHNPTGLKDEDFRRELMTSLEHLAIVGGLLLIAVTGPGALVLGP